MRISALEMYNRVETNKANQEFYSKISQQLTVQKVNAPKTLMYTQDQLKYWKSKDLFFSQTCGLPYKMFLHNKVTLIGTPDYGIKGCEPGYYNSVFVVREENRNKSIVDFNNSILAVNDYFSQSGWAAPQNYMKNLQLKFNEVILSGSHRNSAKLVSQGKANITAIDAISFKMIQKYDYFSANLSIIGVTNPTPGLPFIAYQGADREIFYKAIENAIDSISSTSKTALQIRGLVSIPKSEYLKLQLPSS
jgi:ABC-type phosphate/phosphonate transport system substrate-binding protein